MAEVTIKIIIRPYSIVDSNALGGHGYDQNIVSTKICAPPIIYLKL
jgi:hypothetical protein